MMRTLNSNLSLFCVLYLLLVFLSPATVNACGIAGPIVYLLEQDDAVLGSPEANFRKELDIWFGSRLDLPEVWIYKQTGGKLPAAAPPPEADSEELRLYQKGATLYHAGDLEQASQFWRELLELPENARKHRSVWAAYMLGRIAHKHEDKSKAAKYYKLCREFAKDGYFDSESLAAESLGWEGRLYYEDDPLRSIGYYAKQYRLKVPSAYASLLWNARKILQGDSTLYSQAARDIEASYVVSAYILSGRGFDLQSEIRLWLKALIDAKNEDWQSAERIAWMAYKVGDFQTAKDWSDYSPYGVYTKWIRAKLHLRDGEIEDAALLMKDVLEPRFYPVQYGYHNVEDHSLYVRWAGELATILTQREDYLEALQVFLYAGHHPDAAYLAERVLTIEELKEFVDSHWNFKRSESDDEPEYNYWYYSKSTVPQDKLRIIKTRFIREILARRLLRAERWDEAVPYFPSDIRQYYTKYLELVRDAYSQHKPTEERIAAFWNAAAIIRWKGSALMAFEMSFYGREYTDNYATYRLSSDRLDSILRPTTKEVERIQIHKSPFDRADSSVNSNYRYRAAELAWWACSLMPNNNEMTARRLTIAGLWIGHRDPKAAERFYHALCVRCPDTEIGQAAIKNGWFTRDLEDDTRQILSNLFTQKRGKL